ncbi:Fis family transcriptional regulator [Rugosibacter aromaticivorans]|uniref:Fis family transcriptional regulator n=1 Tax=Rugosibacter aromaticivorans TaxID=1565605 RepID=A0A0C5JAC7_9PROT|nr:sigma-54 dependent transcriptional regulator [Rugosibacter aromaticivorans]AJP48723.1 Fis family transcriptional regulator [Rugosibacter aromaticivorans]
MNALKDKAVVLIVDDDPLIADTLGYFLSRDYTVLTATRRKEAINLLRQEDTTPAVALIDLGLPPTPHAPDEGFALIAAILAHSPLIRIIILSGQNEEANARHARALGATEFVSKPASPEDILKLIQRMLAFNDDATEIEGGLVGNSAAMQNLRAQIKQFAPSPFPVLIEGESGSGKELVASGLHRYAKRANEPYLTLNCAAISPNLMEATLFGHGKGAFTGATGARAGYFEEAAGGTLFLDEIGELPLDLQPKLLRVLENNEFQRVGETQARHTAARIVAATNRDLKKEVREGRFRADLYHRLSVFTINVPPVRELGADRLQLFDHFRALYSAQTGSSAFQLSQKTTERLLAYSFPGNVRELRNIVIRLITKHAGKTLALHELEAELDIAGAASVATVSPAPTFATSAELVAYALRELKTQHEFSLDATLRRWEEAYIEAARQLAHDNLSQVARLLGINRTTLYNRIDALGRAKRPPSR